MGYMLRKYQQNQLEWLKKKAGTYRAIESPTGSGKSLVLWEYIRSGAKYWNTAVLSTGFNALAFQFYELAKSAPIENADVKLLIGKSHLMLNEDGICYSKKPVYECSGRNGGGCSQCSGCKLDDVYSYMRSSKKKVIITNHSFYFSYKEMLNADLLVMDECHTVSAYWLEHCSSRVDGAGYSMLKNYMNLKQPLANFFKQNVNRPMDDRVLKAVCADVLKHSAGFDVSAADFERDFTNTFRTYSSGMLLDTGNAFEAKVFSNKVHIGSPNDAVFASATVDMYTLKMLGARADSVFRQQLPENRYEKSSITFSHENFQSGFFKTWKKRCGDKKKGLVLCTSLAAVDFAVSALEDEVPVFRDLDAFRSAKIGALIGSKGFYQGVDMPDLEYVILDKMPFEVWDAEAEGYSRYMKVTAKVNSWSELSYSMMMNSMLQGFGRLWRKNDLDTGDYDSGDAFIFDERLGNRFQYTESEVLSHYPGIKCSVIEKED